MSRCLIALEYWSPALSWLAYGLARLNRRAGPWRFTLTDTRWFNHQPDLLAACHGSSVEPTSLIGAYRDLADGAFDAVVVGETSELLWVMHGLRRPPAVVVLDSNDSTLLSMDILKHPCVRMTLKAQYPRSGLFAADRVEMRPLNASEEQRVRPWPYFPGVASSCSSRWTGGGGHAWFVGWHAPPVRVDIVRALRDSGIPFRGGVHRRTDIKWESAIDDATDVETPRLNFSDWEREMTQSDAVVDVIGNGPMTHRFVEAMRRGCPIVAQRRDAAWPGPEPRDSEEVVWFYGAADVAQACRRVLEDADLRQRLSVGARRYYTTWLAPEPTARAFVSILDEVTAAK